jgi:hypothetical protein
MGVWAIGMVAVQWTLIEGWVTSFGHCLAEVFEDQQARMAFDRTRAFNTAEGPAATAVAPLRAILAHARHDRRSLRSGNGPYRPVLSSLGACRDSGHATPCDFRSRQNAHIAAAESPLTVGCGALEAWRPEGLRPQAQDLVVGARSPLSLSMPRNRSVA